jgi:hypothetical protein
MTILRQLSTHVVVLVSAPCMLPEVVLNPEKISGYFRFWNSFIVNSICCRNRKLWAQWLNLKNTKDK